MNVALSAKCNLFVGCYPQQLSVKSDVQAHMSTYILCAKIAGGQSMLVLVHPHLAPPSPASLSPLIIQNFLSQPKTSGM